MQKKSGFTLVELLIVMAIIAILAAVSVGVMGISQKKALTVKTTNAIHQIDGACKSYYRIFEAFPNLNQVNLVGIKDCDGASVYPAYTGDQSLQNYVANDANPMIEFNKRLRYILEDLELTSNPAAPKAAQTSTEPLVQEKLPKKKLGGIATYTDGWGNPLRVWWGRNHKGDNPKGPDNYDDTCRYSKPLDIYSMGVNKQDEILPLSTDLATTVTFTNDNVDDIASWQGLKAK